MMNRRTFGLWYYTFFLVAMWWRYCDGLMLSQLGNQPILAPRVDPVVWTLHALGFSRSSLIPILKVALDVSMIVLPLMAIYRLLRRLPIHRLALFHFLGFLLYTIIAYLYPTLSIRKYLGFLWIGLAFVFVRTDRFATYIEVLRYYVLFLFGSAGLWKLLRGTWLHYDHMTSALKTQHVENIVHFPNQFLTKVEAFVIHHPALGYGLFLSAVVMQLFFWIGFFTKKYDKILALLMVAFVLLDFLIMRIEYWEILVFLPLLWNVFEFDQSEKEIAKAQYSF